MASSRKRAANSVDGGAPAKKARLEPPKLAIAFAWGNKKFSDAQVKIFEEVSELSGISQDRRTLKTVVTGFFLLPHPHTLTSQKTLW